MGSASVLSRNKSTHQNRFNGLWERSSDISGHMPRGSRLDTFCRAAGVSVENDGDVPRPYPIVALINAPPLLCLCVLCICFTGWTRDAQGRQVLAHERERGWVKKKWEVYFLSLVLSLPVFCRSIYSLCQRLFALFFLRQRTPTKCTNTSRGSISASRTEIKYTLFF